MPGSSPAPDTIYLYAFDGCPSASGTPVDWGSFGSGGKTGGSTASPAPPGFMAEFGGGWSDPWGGAPWDASTGDLLLGYTHSGFGEILVTPPGRSANPLLLIIVDDDSALSLWRLDTPSGAVIVYGPEPLRTVSAEGASLKLSGDTTMQSCLALIFVNGWNLGQYVSGVGPQATFVLPNGILNPCGQNTLALALAVTSGGTSAAAHGYSGRALPGRPVEPLLDGVAS